MWLIWDKSLYFARKGFLVTSYGPNYTIKGFSKEKKDSSNYQTQNSKAIVLLELSSGFTKTVYKLSHIHCSILFMQPRHLKYADYQNFIIYKTKISDIKCVTLKTKDNHWKLENYKCFLPRDTLRLQYLLNMQLWESHQFRHCVRICHVYGVGCRLEFFDMHTEVQKQTHIKYKPKINSKQSHLVLDWLNIYK